MISRILTLLGVVMFTVTSAQDFAYNPGAVLSIDTIMIENHKLPITNFILEKLNTVKIPNIPFGSAEENGISGQIANNTYELAYVTDRDKITIDYHPEDNAITFTVLDVMAKFHSNLVEVQDGFIHTTGELEADIYKVEFVVGAYLASSIANNQVDLLPSFQAYHVTVMIDRKHVDVTVTGSILSNFADVLAKIFIGKICDGIEVEVAHILTKQIPKILNKGILRRQGVRQFFKTSKTLGKIASDMTIPATW